MRALAALLPLVPAALALVGFFLPIGWRRPPAALGIAGAASSLVFALILAVWGGTTHGAKHLVSFGDLGVSVAVRVDPTAALVAVAVGAVALAVQVYSVAYLAEDTRYAPYAAQVSLFTAAMLTVVVADDLIMLLVGWEVMGICSYLLIGHDRTLPEAPAAAVKAFLVTRVGDVGFLLGIALLGLHAHSFAIEKVLGDGGSTVAALLLLAGVAGKSAQFPLHTWLPDAMAGPTPISALIHAATMVAAGIYVVARLFAVFTPTALAVLGVMAAVTMLLGALAATAQDDIKRVLAWSTVSQLAYMAGGLAVGAPTAALFHLLTHAAFKALLFLAAGCVIHAVGTNLMSAMGGLRTVMPATFWSTTIGLAALAGVPPFAGFWSKDFLLFSAFDAGRYGRGPAWVGWLVYAAGTATALVTAWYCARLWLRTFFGEYRGDGHPHEAPGIMRWPVVLLAVPAATLGLYAILAPGIGHRLGSPDDDLIHIDAMTLVPIAAVTAGLALAWLLWRRAPAEDPAAALGPARPVFAAAFHLDAVQSFLVVRPVTALARLVRRTDETLVDGAVEGTGRGTSGLGALLARAHAAGLPRYATAVLVGALLIGAAAVVVEGLR